MLCQLLDPADPMGRDWCLLAVQLEMTDKVPKLDGGSSHESKKVCSQTARVLDEWEQNASSTIGKFISTNFYPRATCCSSGSSSLKLVICEKIYWEHFPLENGIQ